nr:deleted in malignant brain tumors 1 protein-like [Lytechinus pictus]
MEKVAWGALNFQDRGKKFEYFYDIRLVGGSHENEGRVEIYYSSQWNTICDSGWGIEEAMVVCRQLGYNTINVVARHNAYYGQGSGLTRKLLCSGHETNVRYCSLTYLYCDHSEDAGVECGYPSTTYDPFGWLTTIDYYDRNRVRLVGGNTPREGRVEIWFNGQWSTVCDDAFYDDEAEVVCRQLGYNTENAVARGYAYYGEGSGPTILRVTCYGWELTLSSCTVTSRYSSTCGHHEDVGVECGYSTSPTYTLPPSWNTSNPSSRIIGIMSFIGVSLFLLTIASFVAVLYTCNKSPIRPNSATVVELQPMSSTSTTTSSALDPNTMTQMQVNLPTESE